MFGKLFIVSYLVCLLFVICVHIAIDPSGAGDNSVSQTAVPDKDRVTHTPVTQLAASPPKQHMSHGVEVRNWDTLISTIKN